MGRIFSRIIIVQLACRKYQMEVGLSDEESNALLAATDPDKFRGSLSIHSLQEEIFIEHVFPYLVDVRTIASAERVCRRWKRLIFRGLRHLSFYGVHHPNQKFVKKLLRSSTRAQTISFDSLTESIASALSECVSVSIKSISIIETAVAQPEHFILHCFPALERVALLSSQPYSHQAINSVKSLFYQIAGSLKAASWPFLPPDTVPELFLDNFPNLRELYCSGDGAAFENFKQHLEQRPLSMKLRLKTSRDVASILNTLRNCDRESREFQRAVEYLVESQTSGDSDPHWLCNEVLYSRNGTLETICSIGRLDLLRSLLESGVSPNVSLTSGSQPPIFCAITQRNISMLDLLLEPQWLQDINLHARPIVPNMTDYTCTPLLWNALLHIRNPAEDKQESFEEILFKLLGRGANINAAIPSHPSNGWQYKQHKGANLLSLLLNASATPADILLMRKLIKMGARLSSAATVSANSLLLPIIWNDAELFSLIASEAGGYAFYHKNVLALKTAIERGSHNISKLLVTDAASFVSKEEARSIVSCCVSNFAPKLLARFLELLFRHQPQIAADRAELLDVACLEQWLSQPAKRINQKHQFDLLDTLIRFGLSDVNHLGLSNALVSSISARNAALVEFIISHGGDVIPDKDQEFVSAALALHVFFPSQIGDSWYRVLDLLNPAVAKLDEAVECAARKHNKYFLSLLRRYIASRSSQSIFTAEMIPTDDSLMQPKGAWLIV